jgi:hypothetical protein
MTEKTKLWPSASPRGLSWLGHICSKGNEQAGFWLGPLLGFFDSRFDELSPPELLDALDVDCFGERQTFFRRDDDESRRFSGF